MNDIFYDSWAWIEIYADTQAGRRLDTAYGGGGADIHTSIWALAEVGAMTHLHHGDEAAAQVVRRMEHDAAEVHAITIDDVLNAATLRTALRAQSGRPASLGDAVMLSQARRLRMPFISGHGAFDGQPDVRAA